MGTPDFAATILSALIDAGHHIRAVYTQPPRPAGRGHRLHPSPVQNLAEQHGLPVHCPASLRDPAAQAEFAAIPADAAVVVAYGLLLPKPVLNAPRLGCINVHASLLPRWRGAAPIQRAILAGDAETGITIMQMDEGLDTGPILLQRGDPDRAEKRPPDDSASGSPRSAPADRRSPRRACARHACRRARSRRGRDLCRETAPRRGPARLAPAAAALERQVRAFDPWPGAFFEGRGERIRVLAAEADAGTAAGAARHRARRAPLGRVRRGRVPAAAPAACRPRPLDTREFLRGFALPPGTVLPCPATS